MKKKILLSTITCLLLVTGCGRIPKLENGEEVVAELKDKNITAQDLYEELKKTNGTTALVNLIDDYIANVEIEDSEDIEAQAQNELASIKYQYETYKMDFGAALKQAGYDSEEDLLKDIILNQKKSKVAEKYIKENKISDEEVQKYYDENIFGDMSAKHILIMPKTETSMNEDEIKEKEEEALNKAKDLINQLNDGADFEKLARENSDDKGSASEGGLISGFTKDSVVSEFWDACEKLEDGKYTSEPVKSSYGYHIILKVSQNEKPSLEDSKDDILSKIASAKLAADTNLAAITWDEIRTKKYNLNIIDDNIKKVYDETISNYNK